MRLKNLLGLMAIGGAVAYAHKQRGGDLSLDGIKGSLNNLIGNVKDRLGQSGVGQRAGMSGQQRQNLDDVGGVSGVGSSVGGTSGSYGTDDFGTSSSGYSGDLGGNGSTRRY